MNLVCISDTHGFHYDYVRPPSGDVLIVAGDITRNGTMLEVEEYARWLDTFDHPHKLVVAGNHDWCCQNIEETKEIFADNNCTYLHDSGVTIEDKIFWGSPYTLLFSSWAFMDDESNLKNKHWNKIPDNTSVLITHGPPKRMLDKCKIGEEYAGSETLMERVLEIKPTYHIFGHIHEQYGIKKRFGTYFVNTSVCNFHYNPINKPFELEL